MSNRMENIMPLSELHKSEFSDQIHIATFFSVISKMFRSMFQSTKKNRLTSTKFFIA